MQIITEYFLLAIFITFFVLYMTSPEPKIILKYPSVKNKVSDIYKDDNGICYRYHRNEIKCPANNSLISKQEENYINL